MGIDLHAFHFLEYVGKRRKFGNTVTIGRQKLALIEPIFGTFGSVGRAYHADFYCERLLQDRFGAETADSIDNSDYENATIIHDMNAALPDSLHGRFDTIIDTGCSEHIFDVAQALRNYSLLGRPGAQIIHVLPANNFCGHGFWQFSPEMFYSMYSEENGYSGTEVFVARLRDKRQWFRVRKPANGVRVNVSSRSEVYVLARTVIDRLNAAPLTVQQSDYVFAWDNNTARNEHGGAPPQKTATRDWIRAHPLLYSLSAPAYHGWLARRHAWTSGLNRRNVGLEKVRVADLLRVTRDAPAPAASNHRAGVRQGPG